MRKMKASTGVILCGIILAAFFGGIATGHLKIAIIAVLLVRILVPFLAE